MVFAAAFKVLGDDLVPSWHVDRGKVGYLDMGDTVVKSVSFDCISWRSLIVGV